MNIKEIDIDLDKLMKNLNDNVVDDIKTFEDVVNLEAGLNREIYIGEITAGLGQTVEGYIRFWNKYDNIHSIPLEERQPIKIYIDSIGGSLTDTLTIIDAIALSKTKVETICTGAAYSGGFFIFIAGHERIAYPHSSYLYHEGSTSTGADAGKFRNYAEFYQKEMKQLENITLKYTKITPEEYKEHIKDDWWLMADEAVKYGVADKIAEGLI
mgnify:CR=1 FL=1